MAQGLTRPLAETSGTSIYGSKMWLAHDNLTAICELIILENVGGSTSHNPMGIHSLLLDSFTFLPFHLYTN
jgi:hypothetical protein